MKGASDVSGASQFFYIHMLAAKSGRESRRKE